MSTGKIFIKPLDDTEVEVRVYCFVCRKNFYFNIRWEDLRRYRDGEKIQFAFPYLSDEQRELMISGMCDSCYPRESDEDEDVSQLDII
jgi:hypothetical protein